MYPTRTRFALLSLLSMALAACSQGQTPTATGNTGQAVIPGMQDALSGGQTFTDSQAAYDALALSTLNAQALATQAYLNVLPIPASPDSVRAYVKTNFPPDCVTSIDWGDGSALTPVVTPSTSRIETHDHGYQHFGTYTVTLTTRDAGGAVVDTRTSTLQAGRKSVGVVLNFDSPAAPSGTYIFYGTAYSEQGYTFTRHNSALYQFATNYGGGSYNWGSSQGLYTNASGPSMDLTAANNAAFTLTALDVRDVRRFGVYDFTIVGTRADGSTVTTRTHETLNGGSTLTFDASWTNLRRVTFGTGNEVHAQIIDNVHISTP